MLEVLCSAREYDELPVRHNEDQLNTTLCGLVRFPPDARTADDPHTKANLLLQVADSLRLCPDCSASPSNTHYVLTFLMNAWTDAMDLHQS